MMVFIATLQAQHTASLKAQQEALDAILTQYTCTIRTLGDDTQYLADPRPSTVEAPMPVSVQSQAHVLPDIPPFMNTVQGQAPVLPDIPQVSVRPMD
jgi:hypothetical protein